MDELPPLYSDWERWAAAVSESHANYPGLIWFRSPVSTRSWLVGLVAMMDSAALYHAVSPSQTPRQARLCLSMGINCLRSMARALRIPYDDDPLPTAPVRLSRQEFDEGFRRLESVNFPAERSSDEAWRNFKGWRVNYEPIVDALTEIIVPHRPRGSSSAPGSAWPSSRSCSTALRNSRRGSGVRRQQDLQDAVRPGVEQLVGLGRLAEVHPVGEGLAEAGDRPDCRSGTRAGQVPGIGANTARTVRLFKRTMAIGKGRSMLRFTPTTETVPPGAAEDTASTMVASDPTASITLSAPRPPVASSTCAAPGAIARIDRLCPEALGPGQTLRHDVHGENASRPEERRAVQRHDPDRAEPDDDDGGAGPDRSALARPGSRWGGCR